MANIKEEYKKLWFGNTSDVYKSSYSEGDEVVLGMIKNGVKHETIMPFQEIADVIFKHLDLKIGGGLDDIKM